MKALIHTLALIAILSFYRAASAQTVTDVVCADMIARFNEHKANANVYGAYFVSTREQKAAISKLVTNTIPRLDVGTNNLVNTKNGLFDKITKKRATVFSAKIQTISITEAAVSASWAAGPEAAASYEYHLTNNVIKTNWIIVSRVLKHIS